MPRPAVFLDRDDTLIVNRAITNASDHPGDLFDPSLVQLTPGAAAACKALHAAGFALVVVTNQGAVARGVCTIAQVEATNQRLRDIVLAESGVSLDAIYYCPYHPKGSVPPWNIEHPTRKPHPGMYLTAARDLGLALHGSWAIGDAERDIEAALAAGIDVSRTIIVGESPAPRVGRRVKDMAEAARFVATSTPLPPN